MNFKQHIIFSVLLLSSLKVSSQFLGGSTDGHSSVAKTDIVSCTLPQYTNLAAKGGSADGHSSVAKTDIVSCTLPQYTNLAAKGGSADGHSLVAKTDIVSCSLPQYANLIGNGGNADGHSLVAKTDIVSCTLPQYANLIGNGGNADGHSLVAKTDIVSCTLPAYAATIIGRGGSYDGNFLLGPSACLAVLPIELLSFTATLKDNNKVLCEWKTANETNNDYFTIEKTMDTKNYSFVGEVSGAGNSTTTLSYSFPDERPFKGTSYYRLKQTDFDGKYKYSQLVAITIKNDSLSKSTISIYPNPVTEYLNVYMLHEENLDAALMITDVLGRIVYSQKSSFAKGVNQFTIPTNDYSEGMYVISIKNTVTNKSLNISRFIKLKNN